MPKGAVSRGQVSSERSGALQILRDVRSGMRADESFARRAAALDSVQRRFLMELAYGTIRWRKRLDFHLDTLLRDDLSRLPPDVISILEMGAYQLLFMDRVPARAAVDESVNLTRAMLPVQISDWASGIVNAVLRNLDRRRAELPLPDGSDLVGRLAVEHSHPEWMVQRWLERFGLEPTQRFLQSNNEPPHLHLAINRHLAEPADVFERLHESGHVVEMHPLKSDAIVVRSGARPESLPGWDEGWFWVQDVASQWVVDAAPPQPDSRILDACAAPGTKLCGLLNHGPGTPVVATDRNRTRLRRVGENCDRLGLSTQFLITADARRLPTDQAFDYVLADVPCTGTGVLRRRVDSRWRRQPEDVDALSQLQLEILRGIADHVVPGGSLVYATCSVEPEENEEVVSRFLEEHADFSVGAIDESVPDELRAGPYLSSRPWTADLDGMFAARLRRGSL